MQSVREIQLRRLIERTDGALESGKYEDAVGYRKLVAYVQTMREYLGELESVLCET